MDETTMKGIMIGAVVFIAIAFITSSIIVTKRSRVKNIIKKGDLDS